MHVSTALTLLLLPSAFRRCHRAQRPAPALWPCCGHPLYRHAREPGAAAGWRGQRAAQHRPGVGAAAAAGGQHGAGGRGGADASAHAAGAGTALYTHGFSRSCAAATTAPPHHPLPFPPTMQLQHAPSLAWDLHTSPEFLMQLPPGSPDSLSRSSSLDGTGVCGVPRVVQQQHGAWCPAATCQSLVQPMPVGHLCHPASAPPACLQREAACRRRAP